MTTDQTTLTFRPWWQVLLITTAGCAIVSIIISLFDGTTTRAWNEAPEPSIVAHVGYALGASLSLGAFFIAPALLVAVLYLALRKRVGNR